MRASSNYLTRLAAAAGAGVLLLTAASAGSIPRGAPPPTIGQRAEEENAPNAPAGAAGADDLLLPDISGPDQSWRVWAAVEGIIWKVPVAEVGKDGRAVATAAGGGASWGVGVVAPEVLRSGELGHVASEGGIQSPETAAGNVAMVFVGSDAKGGGGGARRAVVAAGRSAEVAWERLKAGVAEAGMMAERGDGGVTAHDGQLWVVTVEASKKDSKKESNKAPFPSDHEVQEWARNGNGNAGLAHVVDLALTPWTTPQIFRRTVKPGDKVFVVDGKVWRRELDE